MATNDGVHTQRLLLTARIKETQLRLNFEQYLMICCVLLTGAELTVPAGAAGNTAAAPGEGSRSSGRARP